MKIDSKKYLAAYNYAIAVETDNPDDITANIAAWDGFVRVAKSNPKAKTQIAEAQSHIKELKELKEQQDLQ
jgi:hypothetical protein